MWRPNNWDIQWDKWRLNPESNARTSCNRVDFEAGADAMIEVLKKSGRFTFKEEQVQIISFNNTRIVVDKGDNDGWLVFINTETHKS